MTAAEEAENHCMVSPVEYRRLALTIANQAQAIGLSQANGPMHAAVVKLVNNVETLRAWTQDDRS